jgi:hypothetical protein
MVSILNCNGYSAKIGIIPLQVKRCFIQNFFKSLTKQTPSLKNREGVP